MFLTKFFRVKHLSQPDYDMLKQILPTNGFVLAVLKLILLQKVPMLGMFHIHFYAEDILFLRERANSYIRC